MRRRWFVWKSFCLNLCKLSVSRSCEEVNISKKCCDVFLDESVVKSPNFCYPTERKNKSHMCGREGIRNGHVIQTKFTLICFPDQFSGRDYKTKYIIHQCTSEIWESTNRIFVFQEHSQQQVIHICFLCCENFYLLRPLSSYNFDERILPITKQFLLAVYITIFKAVNSF